MKKAISEHLASTLGSSPAECPGDAPAGDEEGHKKLNGTALLTAMRQAWGSKTSLLLPGGEEGAKGRLEMALRGAADRAEKVKLLLADPGTHTPPQSLHLLFMHGRLAVMINP